MWLLAKSVDYDMLFSYKRATKPRTCLVQDEEAAPGSNSLPKEADLAVPVEPHRPFLVGKGEHQQPM